MFAVITQGKTKRTLNKFKKGRVTCETVRPFPGCFYFLLTCFEGRGGINWQAVCDAAGEFSKRAVLAEKIVPPPESGIEFFRGKRLKELALINTAADFLADNRIPSVTLADFDGHLAPQLVKLIPLSSVARVITENPAAYEDICAYVYSEYGACSVICSKGEKLDSTFLITAEDEAGAVLGENVNIFTFGNLSAENRRIFRPRDLIIPDTYADKIPSGVNPTDFLGAMYEYCRAPGLSDITFRLP